MADKKGTVLCVDDEPNILRSLTWLLQKDFDVKTAASGQDGLALVRANDFDVIISDQRMPGMMGSEFLREVRKLSPRSIRMLLTGYSDLQAILRSVNDSEVFRFINKPWKIDELPALVAEAAHIAKTHPATVADYETTSSSASLAQDEETILVIDNEPNIAEHLRSELGNSLSVMHVNNIADALAAVSESPIGIILSDTRVDNVDTTALLRTLKQQHPEIVTVVYTDAADSNEVINLINQGQIFRFIPKPVKTNILALAITAAARKRQQLKANPELARRHAVEDIGQSARAALVSNIHQAAQKSTSATKPASFLQSLSGGIKRLFGGA